MKKIILVMFLLVSSLGFAKWQYKEEKDDFSDKVTKMIVSNMQDGTITFSDTDNGEMFVFKGKRVYDFNEVIETRCAVTGPMVMFPVTSDFKVDEEVLDKMLEQLKKGKTMKLRVKAIESGFNKNINLANFTNVYNKYSK